MRKAVIRLNIFLIVFSAFNVTILSQYCIPTSTYGTQNNQFINGVILGTISNIGTGSQSGPSYSDYSSMLTMLSTSSQNDLKITGSPSYSSVYYYAWIDYNQDGDFTDVNEQLGFFIATTANQTTSILFNVPVNTLPGITRLRVTCAYNSPGLNPCSTYNYGETEDYSVQIPRFTVKSSIVTSASYGSGVWADINNDGYLDALFADGTGILHIYQNSGGTSFSDINTGLDGPKLGMIVPGDYNRDGKIDLLVTGSKGEYTSPSPYFTKIYKNNGGTFTDINAGLQSLYFSSADWGDFDNDGDLDILIAGMGSTDPVVKIYENNGSDIFNEYPASFKGSSEGDCLWWDYDNDSFLDIIVSGLNIDGNSEIAVYRNDNGKGFYKIPFDFLNIPGSIDIGDYDQDGDQDIIIAGEQNRQPVVAGQPKTVLYRNDGNGNFTNIVANIQNLKEADVKFGDADNDGDLDILVLGRYEYLAQKYIQLYINKGNDIFELQPMSMSPVYGGDIDWGDYDNDNDLDFLYTGNDQNLRIIENKTAAAIANLSPSPPSTLISKMVGNGIQMTWNRGSDNKSKAKGLTYSLRIGTSSGASNIIAPASNVSNGHLKFSRIGYCNQDTTIIISGLSKATYYWSVQSIDQSYCGSAFSGEQAVVVTDPFTEISPGFPQVSAGRLEWADLNSDGNSDVVITGETVSSPQTSIWFKGTGDVFNAYSGNNTLEPASYSQVSPTDFDNDNDVDLYIYGRNASSQWIAKLYQNTGGTFTSVSQPFLTVGGQAAFGDIDNDGDIDVMVGNILYTKTGTNTYSTTDFGWSSVNIFFDYDNDGDLDLYKYDLGQIFKNDGNGIFTMAYSNLSSFYAPSADIGDYDNDGDLDIVVTGYKDYSRYSYVYRNNGDGSFTDIQANIRAVEYGRIFWIDYDNDGDLDISMTGASSTYITRIFLNQGNDVFEPITVNLPENYDSDINWADYDNDGDMDLIYEGRVTTPRITKIYRNNNNYPDPKPNIPGNYSSFVQGQTARLSWKKSTNPSDTIETMSYNVRVGTTPGSCNILAPQSNLASGKPLLHQLGNAQMTTFKILRNLPVATYYWSVQALDKNSNYSSWSPEQSFVINVLQADFEATTACIGQSTTFTDKSIATGVTINSWLWNFGDGTTSTATNPVHTYATDGTFTVTLTIGSGVYSDNISKQVYVNKKPTAMFSSNIVCQGTATSFTNTTNNNGLTISSWFWDFGDGQTAIVQNPSSHGYLGAANYTVILRAQADNGCMNEISKTVSVIGYPSAAVSADGATTFCTGQSVTLTTPANADYTYAWKRDGSSITGATTNTYLAQISGSYTASVTNKGLCTALSSAVPVVVNATPASPLISAAGPLTFCQGNSVDLSVTYNSGYSYQWKLNSGTMGTNSNLYSANASGTYSLVVTNSSNCSANSTNTVNVIVNPLPTIPTINISGPTTFCQGSSVELSVTNTGGNTYQWENNGGAITGATANTYVASSTGVYSLKITNTNNCFIRTENVAVNVLTAPVAPTIAADGPLTFCQGDIVNLSVTNTAGYSYLWKLNGGEVGTNTNTYSANASGTYSLVVTNSANCSVNSLNGIAVTVNPKPSLPTVSISGPTAFCQGGSVELSVITTPGYEYQWENNGAGITGAIFNSIIAQNAGNYTLKVSNSYGCSSKTENVAVTILSVPSAPAISASGPVTFCNGDSVILSVTNSDGYNYQWKLNGGATGTNSNTFIARNTGSYSLVVSNSSTCSVNSANPITVTVNPLPSVSAISLAGEAKFCNGKSATLSVPVNANYEYSWKKGTNLLGISSNSLNATQSGEYSVEVNLAGCKVVTEPVKIVVVEKPAKPTIDTSLYIKGMCLGESPLKLSVDNAVAGYSYKWYKNETQVSNSISIEVLEAGNYYLESSMDICTSDQASVNIVFMQTLPKPDIIAKGPTLWYLSTTSKASYYRWYHNGNHIPGADNSVYVAAQNPGIYRVGISNDNQCFAFSDSLRIPIGVTGIEDTDPFKGVKIYPNPTKGWFTIEMDNNIFGELIIDIFTQNGSKALNIKFEKTSEHFSSQIDLSGQSKGMYLINLSIDKFKATRKILVE